MDVGDVSWVVFIMGLCMVIWVLGILVYFWQVVVVGGMSIGKKGMLVVVKIIVLMGIQLFKNLDICEQVKVELFECIGFVFKYEVLFGDCELFLDYCE